MRWARALVASRKGRIAFAVAACYLVWQAWLSARAPAKLALALRASGERPVDVLVTLPFTPDRFHVIAFQKYGRVSGTLDNRIELRGVKRSDLMWVARPYWVTGVDPLPPGRWP